MSPNIHQKNDIKKAYEYVKNKWKTCVKLNREPENDDEKAYEYGKKQGKQEV